MDMACMENTGAVQGQKDQNILSDERVVQNLLQSEKMYVPARNYFDFQTDIEPYMRKVVAMWMLEVCEEQKVEDSVLPLAINLMDRFLCVCDIRRQQLQLLGATSLLVASKLRCCTHLGIDLLCAYTDNSVSHDNIASWELLILSKLQWELSAVTGFDYVDQVIERCSWGNDSSLLRRHSNTLVSICYTETTLIQAAPSLIAAASICSAVRGLKLRSSRQAAIDVCTMLNVDPVNMELLVRFIDQSLEQLVPESPQKVETPVKCVPEDHQDSSPDYEQPETPTEVDDMYFCD